MLPAPMLTPLVVVAPGRIIIMFAPMLAIFVCKMALEPWPISVMAMTAATAMMTPRADSVDRILLRPSATIAVRQAAGSNGPIVLPSPIPADLALDGPALRGGCVGRRSRHGGFRLPPVLPRRIAFDDTIDDMDDPIRVGGHVGVVRHQDNRDVLGVEPLEHPQNVDAGVRIEVARRLVGQEEHGAVDQRAGDRHPLLLPT